MNRRRDCYTGSSGEYVDYDTYTSSSAIQMPSSSVAPQALCHSVPVERVELQPAEREQRPCESTETVATP